MYGVPQDGKFVLVQRDFSIRVPYGAGYDVNDEAETGDSALTVTRFDELPQNYINGAFEPSPMGIKCDVLNFVMAQDVSADEISEMDFATFMERLKHAGDEQFKWSAVGSVGEGDGTEPSFRVMKVVQNSRDLKVGYMTTDLFVAVRFMIYIFAGGHEYIGKLRIARQPPKFKRTEMFIKSILSSVKPNTI